MPGFLATLIRGDNTAAELFMAAVMGWEAGLRQLFVPIVFLPGENKKGRVFQGKRGPSC
jgi:hypothetical protein